MPRKRVIGARASQTATAATTNAPTDFDMSGSAPEVVEAGSHDVRVVGARAVHYKTGSTSVELTMELLADGTLADLDTLLVNSPGGTSNLVLRNRGMLRDLAEAEEHIGFRALLERLNKGDIRAEVTLTVGTGLGGRTVNKLDSVNFILTDDNEE